MAKVVGVRFRNTGKVYYFDPSDFELRHGDMVVVETAIGNECGRVVLSVRDVPEEKVTRPLRPVIRKADEQDIQREAELRRKEDEAFHICKKKIREHQLDMKLVAAECTFDGKKIMFYFTADGRVDFRELVRDLASVFKMRIELRQIGVRDETRILGGVGICGRQLCCASYLTDFVPVSIRMAKEQNLSLNPGKISGVCGRLMCCLKNEEETYQYLNRNLPGIGDTVQTPDERVGVVAQVNVLRQQIRVLIEEGDEKNMEEYPAEDLTLIAKKKKGPKQQPKKKAMADNAAEGTPAPAEKKKNRPAEKSAGRDADREAGRDAGRSGDKAFGDRSAGRNGEKAFGDRSAGRNGDKVFEDGAAGNNANNSGNANNQNDAQPRSGRSRNRRRRQNAQDGRAAGNVTPDGRAAGNAARDGRTAGNAEADAAAEADTERAAAALPGGEEKKHRRRRRRRRSSGNGAAGENSAENNAGGESRSSAPGNGQEGGTAQ